MSSTPQSPSFYEKLWIKKINLHGTGLLYFSGSLVINRRFSSLRPTPGAPINTIGRYVTRAWIQFGYFLISGNHVTIKIIILCHIIHNLFSFDVWANFTWKWGARQKFFFNWGTDGSTGSSYRVCVSLIFLVGKWCRNVIMSGTASRLHDKMIARVVVEWVSEAEGGWVHMNWQHMKKTNSKKFSELGFG